jgi:hypothetical protein
MPHGEKNIRKMVQFLNSNGNQQSINFDELRREVAAPATEQENCPGFYSNFNDTLWRKNPGPNALETPNTGSLSVLQALKQSTVFRHFQNDLETPPRTNEQCLLPKTDDPCSRQ